MSVCIRRGVRFGWEMDLTRSTVACVLAMTLGGCVADVGPEQPLRLPTVGRGEPTAPVPVASATEMRAQATAAAREENWPEMNRLLAKFPWSERSDAAQALSETLFAEDESKTGRAVRAMQDGTALHAAATRLAREKVTHAPLAAVEWALAADQPAVEFALRLAVAEAWCARDARAASAALAAWPASAGRDQMLGFAAAAWAPRDPPAALAWARAMAPGADRTRVLTSMGFALAQTEPEQAVEVISELPEGRDRWLIVGAIGQTWVARRPKDAWAWARQLPAGEAREAALSGIATGLGWSRRQRANAAIAAADRDGGGMAALPPGFAREQALRREFDGVLRDSPAQAADWLETKPLPDRHAEMVDEVARRWLAVNPAAAREWIERTIREPDRREQLLREAGR